MLSVNQQEKRKLQCRVFNDYDPLGLSCQVNEWLEQGRNVQYHGPARINDGVWAITVYYWVPLEENNVLDHS